MVVERTFEDHSGKAKYKMTIQQTPGDIDIYIAGFPTNVQAILQKKTTIRKAAQDVEETISYKIPAFTLNGQLVYFAAFKNHIGLYPPVAGCDLKFRNEKSRYEGPKSSLQFPLDQPIPYALIGKIVKLRVKENLDKSVREEQE
jgi:uncharacterized protein YdhG (YjbR/CyaY superfamily)